MHHQFFGAVLSGHGNASQMTRVSARTSTGIKLMPEVYHDTICCATCASPTTYGIHTCPGECRHVGM